MNNSRQATLLIYWGRRGGGLTLFRQFERVLLDSNVDVFISARPTLRASDGVQFGISPFNFYKWFSARRELVELARQSRFSLAVFVMASPWDLLMGRKLMKSGIKVKRIIHDATPHPGEFFPPKFWIKALLKDCSKILTFSHFVGNLLNNLYTQDSDSIDVLPFPSVRTYNKTQSKNGPDRKILLIGRGKKYQGQEMLESAWRILTREGLVLVIAGEGFKPRNVENRIEYKNHWLNEQDLFDEIASSDVVVFPYFEASQSGTIPICNALRVPVVITPVGGLVEQVENMKNGIISSDVSAKSFAAAIELALKLNWEECYEPVRYNDKEIIRILFN